MYKEQRDGGGNHLQQVVGVQGLVERAKEVHDVGRGHRQPFDLSQVAAHPAQADEAEDAVAHPDAVQDEHVRSPLVVVFRGYREQLVGEEVRQYDQVEGDQRGYEGNPVCLFLQLEDAVCLDENQDDVGEHDELPDKQVAVGCDVRDGETEGKAVYQGERPVHGDVQHGGDEAEPDDAQEGPVLDSLEHIPVVYGKEDCHIYKKGYVVEYENTFHLWSSPACYPQFSTGIEKGLYSGRKCFGV